MAGVIRPGGAPPVWTVWVRRCGGCGHVDLDGAWPRVDLVEGTWWRCPYCGDLSWEPLAVAFPGGGR
jgi:hypothetical protein